MTRSACMAVLCGLVLVTTACTPLLGREESHRLFLLPATAQPGTAEAPLEIALRVTTPDAEAPLASRHVVVVQARGEVNVYAGARWSDRAPVLVRNRLIEALRQDGRLATIVNDESPARTQLTLLGQMGAFHARYPDPADRSGGARPDVLMRLDLQLIDSGSRQVLASRRFEQRQPGVKSGLEAVITALGQAGDALSMEIVEWVVDQARQRQDAI